VNGIFLPTASHRPNDQSSCRVTFVFSGFRLKFSGSKSFAIRRIELFSAWGKNDDHFRNSITQRSCGQFLPSWPNGQTIADQVLFFSPLVTLPSLLWLSQTNPFL
jgi:hypothetical protein